MLLAVLFILPTMSMGTKWSIPTRGHEYHSQLIGRESDKTWNGSFYFVVGADPQFGVVDAHHNANFDPLNTSWSEEMKLAKLTVEKINQLRPKPRFFVVNGDLTNELPTTGVKSVRDKQVEDFKAVFSAVDPEIPLVTVCGNHDVGDHPTVETISKYRANYGDDYFTFWVNGVFFIVLNAQYFKDPTHVKELATEQEQWMEIQLATAYGHRIVCFSHIPWYNNSLDESETIYNIPYDTRVRILNKLYDAGVRHCFFGHMHDNLLLSYKEMEMIITSAIGMAQGVDKSGVRLVKVTENKILHEYYELENMPSTVSLD